MDPCEHPEITHLVGFLSGFGKGPRPSKELYPVMAMSKTELHSDIVAISMEAWVEDVDNDPPWESKSNNKMLWRGKTTGIYFKDDVPWSELLRQMCFYQASADSLLRYLAEGQPRHTHEQAGRGHATSA